jgi:cytochrome P450
MPMRRSTPFDPPPELMALQRQGRPISPMTFPDDSVGWLVTSHSLASQILLDKRFSARSDLRRSSVINYPLATPQPGVFIYMDPPEHTRYRKLLAGQFSGRRLKSLAVKIKQVVATCLDNMAEHGPPVDLVQMLALPVPSTVICELLGVPYSEYEQFQRSAARFTDIASVENDFQSIYFEIYNYLVALVKRKRTEPADDIISGLIANTEMDLTDEELVGISFMVLVAGFETTSQMIALGTYALLAHPDQLELLRTDPTVVDNAVDELLRYLTVAQYDLGNRTAVEDVELAGVLIEAGQSVAISLPAVNRDPAQFDDPDRLDLRRSNTGNFAFGHGVHHCIGQQLARLELRSVFPELLRRFPALRLAVPAEELQLRNELPVYGVLRLPVAW